MVRNFRARTIAIQLIFLANLLLFFTSAQAAIFTVTNTNDSGAGSFRQAILDANASADVSDTITFNIAGTGPFVITPLTALPNITGRTLIDASGEAISGAPGVRLHGSNLGSNISGLTFNSTAGQSSVSWMAITGFSSHGLNIASSFTIISNCYIGIGTDGVTAIGNGTGVRIAGPNVSIGTGTGTGNVISGNTLQGIRIEAGSDASKVYGNKIGTNAAGTAAVPNGSIGVLGNGSSGVFIGSFLAGTGNLISGNGGNGINLGSSTQGWFVSGNKIGTTEAGTAALPNSYGIRIFGDGHSIGSNLASGRNVISGNTNYGIEVFSGADGTDIHGNYIGLNTAGTASLGTQPVGIRTVGTINGLIIGGNADSGYRNVISGHTGTGIRIEAGASNVVITGNFIGTNAAGTAAAANGSLGVEITGSGNVLGGSSAGLRNVISGNAQGGIWLLGSGVVIKGNYIGTNATGTAAVGNTGIGIRAITASNATIGGTNANDGNVISGNSTDGIVLDADTSLITIKANRIGLNAAGTAPVPNGASGIGLRGENHTVGGSTAGERNVISGNAQGGIVFSGTGNRVQGNYIGTDVTGSGDLGNESYGVRIYDATGGELGGDTAAKGNVIAGNERQVSLEVGTSGVVLRNNIIGLNATMTAKMINNGSGIDLFESGNTIGMPGAGNVIAGAKNSGISIGSEATGNVIQGNWIGTNKALTAGLGNGGRGIFVALAKGNTIGGTNAGEANIIAHNGFMGVQVERGDNIRISGNSIFSNELLGIDLGEQYVFPNDLADADLTGNRQQNYPLLSSVVVSAPNTQFEGRLYNEPNTQYTVEFFSSPSCDETGMGEGRTYRGSAIVNTDVTGEGTISTSLNLVLGDAFASATVTDSLGNTSEFSPCAQVGGENPGKLQFFRDVTLAYEGNRPYGEVIIVRSHGLSGTVSATFTISDNTALAGLDYTDVSQVVTFEPWEVVKVIEVPILVDPATELPDPEEAFLTLSAPSGGVTLGLAAAELLIFDQDKDWPGITVNDVSVTEGNAGQTLMTFDVTLTATNHPVTVGFLTESGSAIEGEDFAPAAGTLNFIISNDPQTLQASVQILGDTEVEPDEYFWMRITNSGDGSDWIAYDVYGVGVIINDDGITPPQEEIFKDGFEDP